MTDQDPTDLDLWDSVFARIADCESLATEVVIAATSRGIQADYNSLLRVESADNELFQTPQMRLKIYERKKQSLTNMLRAYRAAAPDPIPPEPPTTAVAQQPAISGTSAVPPPAISGTSERVWPALLNDLRNDRRRSA